MSGMQFIDPIVGGETLIRPSIHSPDFQAGVQGWTIRRDGSAEFNDAVIRGTLQSNNYVPGVSGWQLLNSGLAEFNNVVIRGTNPGDTIITGPSNGPQVRIGEDGANGYVRFPTNSGTESTISRIRGGIVNIGLPNEFQALVLDGPGSSVADESITLAVNSQQFDGGSNANARLYVHDSVGVIVQELQSWDKTNTTIGTNLTALGDFTLSGKMFNAGGVADGNYPQRVVDGKVSGGIQTTSSSAVSDTVIAGANVQNLEVEGGFAYRATVAIDHFPGNGVAAATVRHDYKLWAGSVGTGVQLGGTIRAPIVLAGVNATPPRQNVVLVFIWEQVATDFFANINLSVFRSQGNAGAGPATGVEINSGFSVIIEKIGDPALIQNL